MRSATPDAPAGTRSDPRADLRSDARADSRAEHPPERRAQPRTTYARVMASPQEISRAEADYQRLRAAYLEVARNEPGHEVALAMIGADMDRAHARLQALMGLPRLPFTHEPSTVVRREALRGEGEGPLP